MPSLKGIVTNNLGLKVIAVLLATLLWAYVRFVELAPIYSGVMVR